MNLSEGDPLASQLRDGQFVVILECATPLQSQPFDSAVAGARALSKKAAETDIVVGTAVTDRLRSEMCHDPVDTASVLAEASGKPVLLHLSGKGSTPTRIRELLGRAASAGIRNVLAVTGDRSDQHAGEKDKHRIAPHENGYLDSVEILRLSHGHTPAFNAGAAVNPFKYNPADQYLQYFKMMRKLASGARFLVTHAGWDMKKLHELQWYLQMRDVGVPVVARLVLLSLEDIKVIHEGLLPGIHVARTFAAMLQRESNISEAQSMSAQLQRLGLQVAGCKLLGYSGVQIAGVQNARILDMVLTQTREALARYTSYADWLTAWNEFHNFLSFEPMPDAYYGFSGLLEPAQQMYDPEHCPMTSRSLPTPTAMDRLRSWAFSHVFPAQPRPSLGSVVARLLGEERRAAAKGLRHCFFLNANACPKRLIHGACGGSHPDGTCEFGHATCFFHRVLAVAAARHELDRLEEGVTDD